MNTLQRIIMYKNKWQKMGYPEDIPDEVPKELAQLNLAPSYKAIALALLSNDLYLTDLGFKAPNSEWYSVLKRIELKQRGAKNEAK